MDVIGIDTCVHAEDVLAQGFPARMGKSFTFASDVMYNAGRFGQKNGKGFYDYIADDKGRLNKTASAAALELLRPHVAPARSFSDEEIIARCLVPMATELARCLEEGVVESAGEADMALLYGLGFPTFRGGILRWVDSIGLPALVAMADQYAALGELFAVTAVQREMAATAKRYY
jgi:3-hydroxyacyl-CoA dehydrogenase/enoyl-CoA hydratase/3-hydroxybutyryl-CoA epimerase/enoyl-CoA isomerase